MTVGMTKAELPDVPRFISGRHGHDQTMLQSKLIRRVNFGRLRQPPTHPHATCVIVTNVFGHRTAARSLAALAEKDFARSVTYTAKGRRVTPVPALLPTKFFKPGEALQDVRDIQYRCQAFDVHGNPAPAELLLDGECERLAA